MSSDEHSADLPPVDKAERGAAIRERRMKLGIRSVREFAIRTGVARGSVSGAEHGDESTSVGTFERLEAWLSEQERRGGAVAGPGADAPIEQIEFTVEGDFGVKVTVKGPITDRAALEDSVAKIIRSIRAES